MVFQVSPGINVSEIDLTTVVPAVGTSTGAYAGNFNWGPIEEIVTVSNELELVDRFQKPDQNTFISFFTSANFLSYTNNLKVVRAAGTGARNATANGAGVLIKNDTVYYDNFSESGANTYGVFAAKYAGDVGNSIEVSIFASSNVTAFNQWEYAGYFDSEPNTSDYANNLGGSEDEMHIVVVDKGGRFSGIPNSILERYSYLSKASDAKNYDGTSNYYKNVINDRSKYVWWLAHPDAGLGANGATNWGSTAQNTTFGSLDDISYTVELNGGAQAAPSTANVVTAYDSFRNADNIDISLIMTGNHDPSVVINAINNIAEARQDAIVFVSPSQSSVVNNSGSELNSIIADRVGLPSTSYAFMDNNWKYQFDKYNNVYRWVPLNGDIAGIVAKTEYDRDAWFSPAGFNRGNIKNVIKLAWDAGQAERDELYKKGINSVVTFTGQGTVLYGDKTLLAKPSAFDRINVRRLFIVLEKAIKRASQSTLFEMNDQFTRSQFVALVEPYLRDVQGRRGIYNFKVVCDETNNTPEIINRNEFVGDIYIQPTRSINFIQLNFVAVNNGVSFNEIIGQF